MTRKPMWITLVVALLAFWPLRLIAWWLIHPNSWDTAVLIAAVLDLLLAVTVMGSFILEAIEKNTAAKSGSPQDSADVTK